MDSIMYSFFPGRPTPRVTWWRDHALLDDVSEDIDVATGRVTNELRLRQLRRTDLHSILTCQATNNNISVPASTSVKLDMQCKQLHLSKYSEVPNKRDIRTFSDRNLNFFSFNSLILKVKSKKSKQKILQK